MDGEAALVWMSESPRMSHKSTDATVGVYRLELAKTVDEHQIGVDARNT